jgi:uncharacterized protein YjbI with pentapeptide repeats
MKMIELLEQGKVEEFNQKRPVRGILDLFAADLPNAKLAGADLSGANLEKADLSGADLTGANLARANLDGADLTGAKLCRVIGIRSKWREAYLGEADLTDIDLTQADLNAAELNNANLSGANLTSARMKNAVLDGVNFSEAMLSECLMSGSSFKGAAMAGVDLTNTNLARADLTDAVLTGADLTGANMESVTLLRTDLSAARLRNANLTGANFTEAILEQADFTRADLSEADTESADFSEAILTEAQVDGTIAGMDDSDIPPAARLIIEDPVVAVGHDHVAILWENLETGGSRLRVLVSPLSGKPKAPAAAFRAPVDLMLSRLLAPVPGGFIAAALLERPAGVMLVMANVGLDGALSNKRTLKLGYTPMVRPILRMEGDDLLLYGISREGPTVIVQKLTDAGLIPHHGEGMSTARGFVGSQDPIVLSKGGVLMQVRASGTGGPMRSPSGFPGRVSSACADGDGLSLVWALKGAPGLHISLLSADGSPAEQRKLEPKKFIGNVSTGVTEDAAWAAWSVEELSPQVPASAWAAELPDGRPFPVLQGEQYDVDDVQFVKTSSGLMLAINTLDGDFLLFSLTGSTFKLRWKLN